MSAPLDRAYAAADAASSCVTPPDGVPLTEWIDEHEDLALRRGMVHAALTAALTDPDDPDWLAQEIDPDAFREHAAEARSGLAVLQWAARRLFAREAAAAVRAALLGGAE